MKFFVKFCALFGIFAMDFAVSLQTPKPADLPKYLEARLNITAILGRNVSLVCKVQDLAPYRVAWLSVDTQTILIIDTHVITKNHRIAARHYNEDWIMLIKDVVPKDGGVYMCQINTDPMMSLIYHLNIIEPPNIDLKGSTDEIIVKEGESASIFCKASGVPPPSISWKREDSNKFRVDKNTSVSKWNGEWLNMSEIDRTQSGAYLCIATNGVPPSVSKRIPVNVMFPPLVKASRVGILALPKSLPTLQCRSEAYPLPKIYWTLNNNQLTNDSQYSIIMTMRGYQQITSLSVLEMGLENAGTYRCHVENNLGSASAETFLHLVTTTTTTAITTSTSTVAPITSTTEMPTTI